MLRKGGAKGVRNRFSIGRRQGAGRSFAHELVLKGLRRRADNHPRPGEGGWNEGRGGSCPSRLSHRPEAPSVSGALGPGRCELPRTPLRRSSVVPRPGAPTSGRTIIRLAGIIRVLCRTGYAPPILYIRRPARLGAAGPSDLTALQNSREVHTLRLATARNRSTPRLWLACRQLATKGRVAPSR